MRNTNILCPDCLKGRIITDDNKIGSCNRCGTKFEIKGPNTVRYYVNETKPIRTASIYDFVHRELHYVPRDKWEEYKTYPLADHSKEYDDPKYDWMMCIPKDARDTKYGRTMVSEKFKLRRKQTMGEFYGTSDVD